MKKTLVILVIACLLGVACMSLVGCDSSAESSSAAESTEAAAESTEAAASEAASSEAAGDEDLLIGVSWQDLSNVFILKMSDAMEAHAKTMPNVTLDVQDGQGKPEQQVSQVENFITEGCDAIILMAYDKDACVPCVTKANEAGIPIVEVCTVTANVDDATAFVGCDDVEAGRMEAQFIGDLLGGEGNVCIIEGPMGHSAQISRSEGIHEELEENYPNIVILDEQTANWDRAEAMTLVENWIQSGFEIDAIISENDEMAMGAVKALEASNLEIPVVGIDAIDDSLASIKSGAAISQTATLLQDGEAEGVGSLEQAVAAATGGVAETVIIPWQLVTIDNVDDFISAAAEAKASQEAA